MTTMLRESLDQLLISVMLGATSLGLYAVAVTLMFATTLRHLSSDSSHFPMWPRCQAGHNEWPPLGGSSYWRLQRVC